MDHANKRHITFVDIVGEEKVNSKRHKLKKWF